jgi:hypothetical protein
MAVFGAHAAVVIDGAGWHTSSDLVVPPNITLVPLPPYSPELNAIERPWHSCVTHSCLTASLLTSMPSSMPVAASRTASSKNQDVSDQHAATRGHKRSKFNGIGMRPYGSRSLIDSRFHEK